MINPSWQLRVMISTLLSRAEDLLRESHYLTFSLLSLSLSLSNQWFIHQVNTKTVTDDETIKTPAPHPVCLTHLLQPQQQCLQIARIFARNLQHTDRSRQTRNTTVAILMLGIFSMMNSVMQHRPSQFLLVFTCADDCSKKCTKLYLISTTSTLMTVLTMTTTLTRIVDNKIS